MDRQLEYFSYETDPMLACPCCGKRGLSDGFLLSLDDLRRAVSFPLRVLSGCRCGEYNDLISATGRDGPHTIDAVDLWVYGERVYVFVAEAIKRGFTGIGVNQRGPIAMRLVHLDRLASPFPRPRIWTY